MIALSGMTNLWLRKNYPLWGHSFLQLTSSVGESDYVAPHCPLTVWGELNLRNIQKVDDARMEISLEITFR